MEGKHLAPFTLDAGPSTQRIGRQVAGRLLEAKPFDRCRIGYRDVASATNRLTLIAAMLPPGVVSTHTIFCLKSDLDEDAQWCLLALLNSIVANYLVRLQVTTHVTAALMSRVPVPRPAPDAREYQELARLARALAATGITDDSRDYADLNAIAASLYGLSPAQYARVLDTFPLLPAALRARCRAAMDHPMGPPSQALSKA